MKLIKTDRISYDGCIYNVIAVIWNTVYLHKTGDRCSAYDYTMQDVYKYYRDIKFIESKIDDEGGKHLYVWALPTMRRDDIIGI